MESPRTILIQAHHLSDILMRGKMIQTVPSHAYFDTVKYQRWQSTPPNWSARISCHRHTECIGFSKSNDRAIRQCTMLPHIPQPDRCNSEKGVIEIF
jgi:hypothetical protein